MAGRRLVTLDIRELIRRLRAGETDRAVARDLGGPQDRGSLPRGGRDGGLARGRDQRQL
jgi:hypothetical protein